jgi:hypothetical protein
LSAHPADRRRRETFQALAASLAPAGSEIFDFGCGPGIDARAYDERGFAVGAYDVDPQMREYFSTYCATGSRAGAFASPAVSYDDFLTNADPAAVSLNHGKLRATQPDRRSAGAVCPPAFHARPARPTPGEHSQSLVRG